MAAHGESSEKRSFVIHLASYVLVNAMLTIVDLTSSPGTVWFHWPLLGWGIGLVAHFVSFTSSSRRMKK